MADTTYFSDGMWHYPAWHGGGVLHLQVHAQHSTPCRTCSHNVVCGHDVERLCANYTFGTSDGRGCGTCLHRHNEWPHDQSCFQCKHHSPMET